MTRWTVSKQALAGHRQQACLPKQGVPGRVWGAPGEHLSGCGCRGGGHLREPGTVEAFQITSLSAGSAGDLGSRTTLPLSPAPSEAAGHHGAEGCRLSEQCNSMVLVS